MSSDEKSIRLIEAASALLAASRNKRLNAVPLNKALFYLDLASLRDCGEAFTRNSYIALDNGPVVAKYQDRLIKPLKKSGIATQEADGDARPIKLLELPGFTKLTPKIQELAVKVSRWCSGRTSRELSDYSHQNLGWIIARRKALEAKGQKQVIDMHIAMQQIIDSDPWVNEPNDDDVRKACESADMRKGQVW